MKKTLIKHGMIVIHKRHGVGVVRCQWGPIEIHNGDALSTDGRKWNNCDGIYDVIFKRSAGEKFLHSCRDIYLTKAGK